MATVLQDEKDKELQQPAGAPPPSPMGAASAVPQQPVQPSAPASAPRQGSGRFTNIQKYIQANLPQQGQQGLGERIGEKIQTQASDVRKGIEQARGQFSQQLAPEQQRLAGASQAIQSSIQTAQQNPNQLSPEMLQQFQMLREGTQQGPSEFNASPLQQQQQALAQQAAKTRTEADRFGLLRQYFGQPTYTRGQQRLDQLLLQASPGSLRQLQMGAQQASKGTEQALSGAQSEAQSALQQLAQQRMAAQQQAQEQLGTARTGEEEAISQAEQAEEARRKRLVESFSKAPGAAAITSSDLSSLGLDPTMRLYGLNPEMKTPEQLQLDVTRQQIATPEQQARLQALAQLGGVEESFLGQGQVGGLEQFNPFAYSPEQLSQQSKQQRENVYQQLLQNNAALPQVYKQALGQQIYDPALTNFLLGHQAWAATPNRAYVQGMTYQNVLDQIGDLQRNAGYYTPETANALMSQYQDALRRMTERYSPTVGSVFGVPMKNDSVYGGTVGAREILKR